MKTFIALSLFVAVASAGTIRGKEQLYPVAAFGKLEGRITNGEYAYPGQFPYQVGLIISWKHFLKRCGGALISDQWILTAAQCTHGASKAIVYLGARLIGNYSEAGKEIIEVLPDNFIIHENYDSSKAGFDISLIKLPKVIEFSLLIQPVALPSKYDRFNEGELATIAGWGMRFDHSFYYIAALKYIEVPIITQEACKENYTAITDEYLCVSTKGRKSHCHGDAGGPLVLEKNFNKIVIGIATYPFYLGCTLGMPGLFTRVTEYLDWIKDVTGIASN